MLFENNNGKIKSVIKVDNNRFIRTEMLIGEKSQKKLQNSRVAVFGVGGVGGFAVEALARAGIGQIDIIDSDKVDISNINRQIIALESTVGLFKVDVAKKRILDINPNCVVKTHKTFFTPDTADEFDFSVFDYVIDAIDTVAGKKQLVISCNKENVPIISAMGAGNKLDATAFEVSDIYKTSVCPLARVMRGICKENGIKSLKVVYSKEQPIKPEPLVKNDKKRQTPGSVSFVPSVCGLIVAGEVIKDLAFVDNE